MIEEAENPELQSNANGENLQSTRASGSVSGVSGTKNGASGNVEDSSTNAGNSSTAFSDNSADGTEFVLDNEKDIESQFARVTNHKEGQRSAKDSMSDIRLTQNNPTVKNNISKDSEDYFDISDIKGQFSLGSPVQQARENFNK